MALAVVLARDSTTTISSTNTPTSRRATTPTSSSDGRRDDPAWLDHFALDLQPLPKYFIGPGAARRRFRMPGPMRRGQMVQGHAHPLRPAGDIDGGPPPLHRRSACWDASPSSAAACSSAAAGSADRRPAADRQSALFRLHAHRAMSDVPCEAFMIAALGSGPLGFDADLVGPRRRIRASASSPPPGSARDCRSSASSTASSRRWSSLAWSVLACSRRGRTVERNGMVAWRSARAAIAMALATVRRAQPALTCRPRGHLRLRTRRAARPGHRGSASGRWSISSRRDAGQQRIAKFHRDVVRTPADKAAGVRRPGLRALRTVRAVASRIPRSATSSARTGGCVLWWPLVLFGIVPDIPAGTATAPRRRAADRRLRCWSGRS